MAYNHNREKLIAFSFHRLLFRLKICFTKFYLFEVSSRTFLEKSKIISLLFIKDFFCIVNLRLCSLILNEFQDTALEEFSLKSKTGDLPFKQLLL